MCNKKKKWLRTFIEMIFALPAKLEKTEILIDQKLIENKVYLIHNILYSSKNKWIAGIFNND